MVDQLIESRRDNGSPLICQPYIMTLVLSKVPDFVGVMEVEERPYNVYNLDQDFLRREASPPLSLGINLLCSESLSPLPPQVPSNQENIPPSNSDVGSNKENIPPSNEDDMATSSSQGPQAMEVEEERMEEDENLPTRQIVVHQGRALVLQGDPSCLRNPMSRGGVHIRHDKMDGRYLVYNIVHFGNDCVVSPLIFGCQNNVSPCL